MRTLTALRLSVLLAALKDNNEFLESMAVAFEEARLPMPLSAAECRAQIARNNAAYAMVDSQVIPLRKDDDADVLEALEQHAEAICRDGGE